MLDDEAMIFVFYQDRSHEDSAKFLAAFEKVATDLHVFGVSTLQWFTIDTIEYRDLEDPRVERAIHKEGG